MIDFVRFCGIVLLKGAAAWAQAVRTLKCGLEPSASAGGSTCHYFRRSRAMTPMITSVYVYKSRLDTILIIGITPFLH